MISRDRARTDADEPCRRVKTKALALILGEQPSVIGDSVHERLATAPPDGGCSGRRYCRQHGATAIREPAARNGHLGPSIKLETVTHKSAAAVGREPMRPREWARGPDGELLLVCFA